MGLDSAQISAGVAVLDANIAVLDPAERLESLTEGNDAGEHLGIVLGVWVQERDAPHAVGLLRARRERPGDRGAGDKRDHIAPAQSSDVHSTLHARGVRARISNCRRSVSGLTSRRK